MLSDSERNSYFERKKKEVLDRLLGPETPYPIPDPVTVRLTSPNDGKTWYERPRILKNMNLDRQSQEYLAWYNKELRNSHGRIVTVMEEPIGEVVPPPVK